MKAIIGKKIGMTGVFDTTSGKLISCTLIEAGPCFVTQVRTKETDGYEAIQVAYGEKKIKQSNKSEQGHFAKSNTPVKSYLKEFKNFSIEKKIGESITCNIFTEGEKIDVLGVTKGKGFQGVVKRHGFSGVGQQSHGQHDRSRSPGSIGGSSYPSRVFKGMRMGGRTGSDNVKIKGLKIIKIFNDKNYILVSGAVPGYNGSIVIIQK